MMDERDAAIERLRDLLGARRVRTGSEIPAVYSRDMLSGNRGFRIPERGWPPAAVVRPLTTAEVAGVVRAANESGIKLVCWGGGTNLMGSAAALNGEVLLDLGAMNRVLKIDRASRRVRVQAGATIGKVEERAGRHGLALGHDPWTRDYATVGGAIGPDGIGYLAPRYGSMGELVLGLTLVLPDGAVVESRATERAPGFDVAHLAVGQEGTLGIVTEAVLRLHPRPEQHDLRAFSFRDFRSGLAAAAELHDLGPSVLDFIEPFEEGLRFMPEPEDDLERTLYLGFGGRATVVAAQHREAGRIVASHGGRRRGPDVAREYWDTRHSYADLFARDSRGRSDGDRFSGKIWFEYLHVSLPLARIPAFRAQALEILRLHGALPTEVAVFAHPELMNVYFLKPRVSGESGRDDLEQALEELVGASHAMGGSMEYCHGVGTRLSRFLQDELGAGLAVYDRIKAALDPRGVLPSLGRRSR